MEFNLNSYHYDLPSELIASRPISGRHHSRLMIYKKKSGEVIHTTFFNIDQHLKADTLLVLNNSKVFPCRLIGRKASGAKIEVFILSLVPTQRGYECFVKSSKKKKLGETYHFEEGVLGKICQINQEKGTFFISFNKEDMSSYLKKYGKIPIPPYIRNGESDETDTADYQTVYAEKEGSVASPTAGLHFTEEVFLNLEKKGIQKAFVTLHVGPGTFVPVKKQDIRDHKMHSEVFQITKENYNLITSSSKIVSVGTTSFRTLQSLDENFIPDTFQETQIYLHPGKKLRSLYGLITNFHLPKSSLLMLVSAYIGRDKALELYKMAVEMKYRFYSYGDAMLLIDE